MTRNMVGFSMGSTTKRKRCQELAPSRTLASSMSAGMSCSAARKMSMKVPAVVQTTSAMMAHMATLGPEIHSHQLRLRTRGWPGPTAGCWGRRRAARRERLGTMPFESLSHCGPWMPTLDRMALSAPPLKTKRKTVVIATELVTEGK